MLVSLIQRRPASASPPRPGSRLDVAQARHGCQSRRPGGGESRPRPATRDPDRTARGPHPDPLPLARCRAREREPRVEVAANFPSPAGRPIRTEPENALTPTLSHAPHGRGSRGGEIRAIFTLSHLRPTCASRRAGEGAARRRRGELPLAHKVGQGGRGRGPPSRACPRRGEGEGKGAPKPAGEGKPVSEEARAPRGPGNKDENKGSSGAAPRRRSCIRPTGGDASTAGRDEGEPLVLAERGEAQGLRLRALAAGVGADDDVVGVA